ncbi:MAG: hypothetical protein ACYS80_15845 [Planctomycetota bacterium]|jgi:hypothetical protein
MVAISMTAQQVEILSPITLPLGISDLAFGIIVALIFGCIIFVVKYGKQCCDNIKWIIEICKMNIGKGTEEKEQRSNVDFSVEELSKKEIAEIKEDISNLSQQIKATLAEIKQIRKTEVLKALEDDIKTASTEYAMKFELKRPEYDKAMRILQVTLAKMPEEGVTYNQKVINWIAKAQEKFNEYSPEHFVRKVEAAKARHKSNQNKREKKGL